MSTCGLNSQHAGAGIPGEQEPNIDIDSCFVGERLLSDQIEPIVGEPGAELLASVAGGKFDIQAGCQSWNMGVLRRFVKIPLHSQIGVAHAVGGLGPSSAKERERQYQVPGCKAGRSSICNWQYSAED